jgi:hypothetical protein
VHFALYCIVRLITSSEQRRHFYPLLILKTSAEYYSCLNLCPIKLKLKSFELTTQISYRMMTENEDVDGFVKCACGKYHDLLSFVTSTVCECTQPFHEHEDLDKIFLLNN